MTVRRFVVPVTVSAGGAAEVYSPVLSGKLVSIHYVKTNFADGVDFVITAEGTGETLWSEENVNASATRHPQGGTHSTAGVASVYAADGEAVNDQIALGRDRVKIVIANGGNATTGAFHITVDG